MAAINDLLARWRGWILRKGGARGEALFSEVAWRLLKKSGSGEVHAGYLKKVTRYALIDLDRERNPDSTLLTNEVMPNRQQEKSPVQTLIEAEDVERVQNILDILSSIEREVVRMMVDGMQVPEIARTLGIRTDTVHSRIQRARMKIRFALQAHTHN